MVDIDAGSDTARLRELAKGFEARSRELDRLISTVERRFDGLKWEGEDARAFRARHRNAVSSSVGVASRGLTSLAGRLYKEADEQDEAARGGSDEAESPGFAGGGGGGGGGGSTPSKPVEDYLGDIEKFLDGLGLSESVIKSIVDMLADLADKDQLSGDLLEKIGEFVSVGAFPLILGVLDKGISVAGFAVDLLTDLATNGIHDFDERMVHAAAFAAGNLAISEGIDKGIEVATTSIIGTLTAGIGAAPAIVVGHLLGEAASQAIDHFAGSQIDGISDAFADIMTEAYRFAKEHDFDPVSMTGDAVKAAVAGIGEAAGEAAESAWNSTTEVVGDGLDALNDGLAGLF